MATGRVGPDAQLRHRGGDAAERAERRQRDAVGVGGRLAQCDLLRPGASVGESRTQLQRPQGGAAIACGIGELDDQKPCGNLDGAEDADRFLEAAMGLEGLRRPPWAQRRIALAAGDAPGAQCVEPHALKGGGAREGGDRADRADADVPQAVDDRLREWEPPDRERREERCDLRLSTISG